MFEPPFGNDSSYGDASSGQAGRAESAAQQVHDYARSLEQKVDRLALVTRALWEIVRDRTTVSEAMLEEKVREIDQRDGRQDGKVGQAVTRCHNCGKVVQKGQDTCQYCGAVQGFESVFDWVR